MLRGQRWVSNTNRATYTYLVGWGHVSLDLGLCFSIFFFPISSGTGNSDGLSVYESEKRDMAAAIKSSYARTFWTCRCLICMCCLLHDASDAPNHRPLLPTPISSWALKPVCLFIFPIMAFSAAAGFCVL